jgi:hypothetical protein
VAGSDCGYRHVVGQSADDPDVVWAKMGGDGGRRAYRDTPVLEDLTPGRATIVAVPAADAVGRAALRAGQDRRPSRSGTGLPRKALRAVAAATHRSIGCENSARWRPERSASAGGRRLKQPRSAERSRGHEPAALVAAIAL